MGLFTTTEDPQLQEARKQVEPGELVCPGCKQPFISSGETLRAWNPALGLEGHACPSCQQVVSRRRPGAGGF